MVRYEVLHDVHDLGVGEDFFGGEPMVWVLTQQLLGDPGQFVGVVGRQLRSLILDDLKYQAHEVLGLKGVVQSAHFLEDAAQRPHVRLVRLGLALADLRT